MNRLEALAGLGGGSAREIAVVLAAHGSSRRAGANLSLTALARRLEREYGFPLVQTAFHQGDPPFQRVLDSLGAARVVVVPFFTSAGYFARTVLPRQLAFNRSYSPSRVRIIPPIGTLPQMTGLAERRVRGLLGRLGIPPQRAVVLVVGHGTPRHPDSGESTRRLSLALFHSQACRSSQAAYLDQPPLLEEAFELMLRRARDERRVVLVLPFLAGEGHHALYDLPRRIGLGCPADALRPICSVIDGTPVILDRSLGKDPSIAALIAQEVREASRSFNECSEDLWARGQLSLRRQTALVAKGTAP